MAKFVPLVPQEAQQPPSDVEVAEIDVDMFDASSASKNAGATLDVMLSSLCSSTIRVNI